MENQEIAEVAIDDIRQLATKFLGHAECLHYHYQKQLLFPLAEIFEANITDNLRLLILTTLFAIIKNKGSQIASAWEVIFPILTFSSNRDSTRDSGFSVLELILNQQLSNLEPYLSHSITAISQFALNSQALDLFQKSLTCYLKLTEILTSGHHEHWVSMLQAISNTGQHHSHDFRQVSSQTFISLLKKMISKCPEIGDLTIPFITSSSFPDYLFPPAKLANSDSTIFKDAHEFFNAFITECVLTNSEYFVKYLPYIFELFQKVFLNQYPDLIKPLSDLFIELITKTIPLFTETEFKSLYLLLNYVPSQLSKMTDIMKHTFLLVLQALFNLDQIDKQKIIESLLLYDNDCRTNVESLLRAKVRIDLLKLSYENQNDVSDIISNNLVLNQQVGNNSHEWEQCTQFTLSYFQKLDSPILSQIVKVSKEELIELIDSPSIEIRKLLRSIFFSQL